MEKSQLISQPSSFSESVSPYEKHEQPSQGKAVVNVFAEKTSQTHTTVGHVFAFHQNNNHQELPPALDEKEEKSKDDQILAECPTVQTILTFSMSKESLEKEKTKYLAEYPEKTGQTKEHPRGTDTSLADFFLDKVTIPGTTLTFWDIVKNSTSESFLIENINTIMPMLCPTPYPYPASNAPLLSLRLLYLIQTDPVIASKYLYGAFTILHFLGFECDLNGSITLRKDNAACAARVKKNQSPWQIYQLLRSLYACGFYDIALNFCSTVQHLSAKYGFSKKILLAVNAGSRLSLDWSCPLKPSAVSDYWKAQIEHEYAFEDGIIFERTLPPKNWVSYRAYLEINAFAEFEKGSPPLLEVRDKGWHLPHLKAPFAPQNELKTTN